MTVLAVEDDPDQLSSRVRWISKFFPGHEVLQAIDGSNALEVMANNPVDVIVTDIGMFPMDGLELIEAVRQAKNDIPIFVITGNYRGGAEATSKGATQVFMKPVDLDELMNVLRLVLQK